MRDSGRVQRFIRRFGIPLGLVMLLAGGPLGWVLDSTLLGVVAGMGLMLMIISYRLLAARSR